MRPIVLPFSVGADRPGSGTVSRPQYSVAGWVHAKTARANEVLVVQDREYFLVTVQGDWKCSHLPHYL